MAVTQLGLRLDECTLQSLPRRPVRTPASARAGVCVPAPSDSPIGPIAGALAMLPRLARARGWTSAPALNYRADHVVAFLASPHR